MPPLPTALQAGYYYDSDGDGVDDTYVPDPWEIPPTMDTPPRPPTRTATAGRMPSIPPPSTPASIRRPIPMPTACLPSWSGFTG
ncbi:MAG: hypothetical protein R3F31_25845 [Verrucomicrobiales bacterium]